MNSLEYIGIHSDGRSNLDQFVLRSMETYIKKVADTMPGPVTRITLAQALKTDRQRISRICKTLGITNIFD
jgi:hypothetical protein